MNKQSKTVIALLLSTSLAKKAPKNVSLFATGMNGDEDLGMDITMKGDKFHFSQGPNAPAAPSGDAPAFDPNGPPEKVSVLETPICKTHTTFYGQDGQEIPCKQPQNLSEEQDQEDEALVQGDFDSSVARGPEKVSVLDAEAAHHASKAVNYPWMTRTFFYAQSGDAEDKAEKKAAAGAAAPAEEPKAPSAPSDKQLADAKEKTKNAKEDAAAVAEKQAIIEKQEQKEKEAKDATDPKKLKDLPEPEKVSILEPIIAPMHTTFYDKKNKLWRQEFVQLDQQAQTEGQRRKDFIAGRIGEKGMDEGVYDFVKAALPPLSAWERRATPYDYNGGLTWGPTDEPAARSAFLARSHRKPLISGRIGEKGMDPEVFGFVSHNLPPLSAWEKRPTPYDYNGGLTWGPADEPQQPAAFLSRRHRKPLISGRVGEKGMDPEVFGFVSHNLPPLSAWEKRLTPYDYNGGLTWGPADEPQQPAAFLSRRHRKPLISGRIGEKGMDPEVYGFVSDNLPPLSAWEKRLTPYDYNGGLTWGPADGPQAAFLSTHHRKPLISGRIGEKGMDPEVFGFVSNNLPPLSAWEKRLTPYDYNGGLTWGQADEPAGPPSLAEKKHKKHHKHHHKTDSLVQKEDIANKEVRPDVYHVVNKIIDPAPMPRLKSPPEPDEPWPVAGKKKKEVEDEPFSDADKQKIKAQEELKAKIAAEDAKIAANDAANEAKKEAISAKNQAANDKAEAEKAAIEKENVEKAAKLAKEAAAAAEGKPVEIGAPASSSTTDSTATKPATPAFSQHHHHHHISLAQGEPASANSQGPEKVQVLEPEVYQERANSNKPNTRTTFYFDDKNKVWREDKNKK